MGMILFCAVIEWPDDTVTAPSLVVEENWYTMTQVVRDLVAQHYAARALTPDVATAREWLETYSGEGWDTWVAELLDLPECVAITTYTKMV